LNSLERKRNAERHNSERTRVRIHIHCKKQGILVLEEWSLGVLK
jgi:hypothetical protein